MKKRISIICSIILLIVNFLLTWYQAELFMKWVLFPIFSMFFQLVFEIIVLIIIISSLKKEKTKANKISVFLFILSCVLIFLPIDIIKVKLDLIVYKEEYKNVIQSTKDTSDEISNNDIIQLLGKEKVTSIDNSIIINNKTPLTVTFWIDKGLSINNSKILVYIDNDNPLEIDKFYSTKKIIKIEKNWYYATI